MIDFNRVLVSTGRLMPVFEGTVTAFEGKIFLTGRIIAARAMQKTQT